LSQNKIVPKKISENIYEIPKGTRNYMKVPVRIFANESIVRAMEQRMFMQATHVAWLPGIIKHALVLPDGHMGYGFPIGGVAATDYNEGVISPGGVGYDINCGVRVVRTNLKKKDVLPHAQKLNEELFRNIPAGVGSKAKIRLSKSELNELLQEGAGYCVKKGMGWKSDLDHCEENGQMKNADKSDLDHCEENGQMKNADVSKLSEKALSRGMPQVGSLGSGNHFIEIQYVDKIEDKALAKTMGIIEKDQVVVMIHTGSRGLGRTGNAKI